ncbi:hypothetical protein ME784_17660 [Lactobacillus delbrueckii]|nr:hypothetical protein ME784_17660 [Lactobacillus delbrueckii]GHN23150.1 hypothetical protein ME785_17080 [Lactobacillus delbrueckii]GHN63313.1 hypothetical protein ME807_17200 [Lactobacillus delbrueckii]
MLGYVELMNQCMDRARIAANNAVGNYRNYYCRYEEKMEADLTLANYLLSHIDEAVAKGWIKVYYQPIVDTFSSKISTYEALARWIDPKYGFFKPGRIHRGPGAGTFDPQAGPAYFGPGLPGSGRSHAKR